MGGCTEMCTQSFLMLATYTAILHQETDVGTVHRAYPDFISCTWTHLYT